MKELGWDDYFQNQVDELDLTEAVIGRVFRVESGDKLRAKPRESQGRQGGNRYHPTHYPLHTGQGLPMRV